MTKEHPITPPPELVREWSQNRGYSCADELWDYLATQAARWGADMELEACCVWLRGNDPYEHDYHQMLRAVRRPKPPSLKEQALEALDEEHADMCIQNYKLIRSVLESLPD